MQIKYKKIKVINLSSQVGLVNCFQWFLLDPDLDLQYWKQITNILCCSQLHVQ